MEHKLCILKINVYVCLHFTANYFLFSDLWNKVTFGKVSYELTSLQVLFFIEQTFYKLIPE